MTPTEEEWERNKLKNKELFKMHKLLARITYNRGREFAQTSVCTYDHIGTLHHRVAYIEGKLHNDTCVAVS